MERAGRDPPGDAREVAEEDAECRVVVGEQLGLGSPRRIRPRIDADDLHPLAAQLELDRLVLEDDHSVERAEHGRIDALRERVAAAREVVVSEDDEAGAELTEQPLQLGKACAPREQVAGHDDEVRIALPDPQHRLLDRPAPS